MVDQIARNVPVWVWLVFAALVVVGAIQTRSRPLARPFVMIAPAVMMSLSIYGVVASFGGSVGPLSAWMLGLVTAIAVNERLLLSPRGVRYDAVSARFEVPGSIVPLALMMCIFCTRFAVGTTTAVAPAVAASPGFVWVTSASLGFWSGLFLSRAIRVLRSARTPI
jgi:hypothetical protein